MELGWSGDPDRYSQILDSCFFKKIKGFIGGA